MESQTLIEEIMNKLSCGEDLNVNEIQRCMPQLISLDNIEQCVNVSEIIFKQILPHLDTVKNVEDQIFSPVLPEIRRIILQILQEIKSKLDTNDTEINDLIGDFIQIVTSLIECIGVCLNFIKNQHVIESFRIKSFLNNFGPIIVDTLTHCFLSQEIYKNHFETFSQTLTLLFQKVNEILLKYVDVLKENICLDHIELLNTVLSHLVEMARMSPCLGVRATTETWKLFANLTTKHADELQDIFSLEIPLNVLTNQVVKILQSVVEEKQADKLLERNVKIASFLLRIIIKLCELYPNGVKETIVIDLLLNLFSHSEVGFLLIKGELSPSNLIDRLLVVGTEPLLNLLITNESFSQEIFASKKNNDASYLLLLNAIIKNLIKLTKEQRLHWLSKSPNILSSLAINLKIYGQMINLQLYREILVSCASLFAVLSAEEINLLEKFLMKEISKKEELMGIECMFISDLWLLFIRLSRTEICVKHIEHLSNYKHLVIVKNILLRLESMLRNDKRLKMDINSDDSIIQCFLNNPSPESFLNLIQNLDKISITNVSIFLQLWNYVEDERLGKLLASKLFPHTIKIINKLNNQQILFVIRHFLDITNDSLNLQCLEFLSNLSKVQFPSDTHQENIFETIAAIYAQKLQNEKIQILALKSFDEFAHNTKHEIIVTQTVSGSNELRQLVTNYLQSKSANRKTTADIENYFEQNVKTTFELSPDITTNDNHNNVIKLIENLKSTTNKLCLLHETSSIDSDQIDNIKQIVIKLTSIYDS